MIDFDWQFDTPVEEMVGEAVGAISMCWSHVELAGVFDSDAAADIAAQLVTALRAKSLGLND